jgi:hypothetical protein
MRKTQADRQAEATRAREITERAVGTKLTVEELAAKIRCGLFADRDTLEEAFECAHDIMKGNPAALTAMYIVLNTIAKELVKINAVEVK